MTEEGPGIVPLGKPRRPRMLRLWGIFRVPIFSATFLLMSPAGVGARAKDDFSLVGHHSHSSVPDPRWLSVPVVPPGTGAADRFLLQGTFRPRFLIS